MYLVEMKIETTKLSGHEGNKSSNFQNNYNVSMENGEESKTNPSNNNI